ncbi:MAG: radical SAM protein [Phycicoccus sp.]
MTSATDAKVTTPAGPVDALVDGGDMDCGSGLLLLITRAMRRLPDDGLLGVRSAEVSVVEDLPAWADLAGHRLVDTRSESADGPWWFAVRKVGDTTRRSFSTGSPTPVGHRLWVYTNFDCNLACAYCCAESSPRAASRRLPVDVAVDILDEFRALGGQEVLLTGGEPFMHPGLGDIVAATHGLECSVLTNAMILGRGARRQVLEGLRRDVALQVSVDSATPTLHDSQRGAGTWERTIHGIRDARGLGFRVRVAATLHDEDSRAIEALHTLLDAEGIAAEDRLIRPVAREGWAETGIHVSVDSLEPEPTVAVDGAWWHPVAVADPMMRVADAPTPLAEVFAVVRDAVAVTDAAAASGRQVFRCA